jgi:hypothetical protein
VGSWGLVLGLWLGWDGMNGVDFVCGADVWVWIVERVEKEGWCGLLEIWVFVLG